MQQTVMAWIPADSKLPAGWDKDRIRKVLAFYKQQTDDEAVAEDEAGVQPTEIVMNVPRELVPIVRELIAKRQAKSS